MPRDPKRIRTIIGLITKLWSKEEKLDLCPLLGKHVFAKELARGHGDIWFLEDDKTEERLVAAIANNTEKEEKLSAERLSFLASLERLWDHETDQRLGQLLSNYIVGHFLMSEPGKMLNKPDSDILGLFSKPAKTTTS